MSQSRQELKKIASVQFGVINPEELATLSVCEIESTGTYENGLPVVGGLLDQRMGVTDRGLKCLTCKMDEEHCPGHFGHINLSVPVVHVGFADTILQVLRCVCFHCGKLLISPYGPRKDHFNELKAISHPQKRLQAFAKECSGIRTCAGGITTDAYRKQQLHAQGIVDSTAGLSGCNGTQPAYKRVGFKLSRLFDPAKTKKKKNEKGGNDNNNNNDDVNGEDVNEQAELSGTEILGILSKISDEDVITLGFNPRFAHPKWLITTRLPVPPPQVRPSVTFNGSDRSADDITVCLVQILKVNSAIKRALENNATEQAIRSDIESLTLACAQLVNNEQSNVRQMTSKGGKILKTLRQRVVGKGGRIRSNLMGKRVNFCARTVITGDPNLGIDFVGVPRWIARTLTYPEVVTKFNMSYLQELVKRGPELYPGAQRVIKPDGSIIHLKYAARSGDIILQHGYVVERHIVDNDFILFNRQPSLHKMSLMGHKAKVMPFSSFRLNLSCTSPYNADFDGDEMNLHVAQTPLLRAEIAELMLSPRQIVSPQASKPVMGIVQDSLLGVSKFTRRDTFCDRNLTNNLLMCVATWDGTIPHPAILKPATLWTGKQIFSLIIPKGINMHRTSKHRPKSDKDTNMSFSDATVLISNGQLLSGIVDTNTVGKTEAGIIHIVWLERGWDDTRQFMTSCQQLVNNWLVTEGFSVGIYDLMANQKTLDRVNELVRDSQNNVEELIQSARSGKMKRKPGHNVISTFEANVNEKLGQAIQKTGAAVQEQLSRDNSINAMVYAGSKGSHLNISQIVACVGQQNVSGKRVPFTYRRRSLPHFLKEDVGAASRGFVSSSYIKGLTPTEFYFHACFAMDHQILTNFGYLFGHQIQQMFQKSDVVKDQLLFAQYCEHNQTISYTTAQNWIYRPLGPDEEMYSISTSRESGRWLTKSTDVLQSNIYGHYPHDQNDDETQDDHISLFVTGNHNMWIQPKECENQTAPFTKIPADQLLLQSAPQFKLSGYIPSGLDQRSESPTLRKVVQDVYTTLGLISPEQTLSFNSIIGYWLRCGSIDLQAGSILFSRIQNETSFYDLLTFVGLVENKDYTVQSTTSICSIHEPNWVQLFYTQWGIKYSPDENIHTLFSNISPLTPPISTEQSSNWMPSWYLALYKEECRALISSLCSPNQQQRDPKSQTIHTHSQLFRDQLMVLMLHAGYSAHFSSNNLPTQHNYDNWSVTYTDNEQLAVPVLGKSDVVKVTDYNGLVFCVTVPKGLIITRRARLDSNGTLAYASRPIIIGNCGGREGLVDTAVKTAETGYIQRRLVKSMESIKVHYDATVRNSLGDIIQFVYGEDGMDGSYIEKQQMDHINQDNNSLITSYHFDITQEELLDSLVTDQIKEEVLGDIHAKTLLTSELSQIIRDRDFLRENSSIIKMGENVVRLPCNLPRIILSAQQKFQIKLEGGVKERNGVIRLDLGKRSDLSPLYVVREVDSLLKRLIVVPGKSALSIEAQDNAVTLFSIFIRQFLSSKRVLGEFHLNRKSFDYVLGEVESRFKQALVHPGEMVGAIAAQSIGEPATQMTLNTFHLAGVAAKNASSGVPRLVEIINVARNVKMKGMCIELSDKKKALNEKDASDILNQLEYTRVCDIAESVEIYHDPNPTECVIEEDRDVVDSYLALPDDDFEYENSSPWLLRVVLNSAVAIGKKIEPAKVASMINLHFKNATTSGFKIKCIASLTHQENVKSVLHIRISRSGDQHYQNVQVDNKELLLDSLQAGDEDLELKFLYSVKDVALTQIKLCGITDITKIFLSKRSVKYYDDNTGALVTVPEDKPGGEYLYFDTEGTNLKEVIVHPDVDHTTCYSNFCPDMLPVCGIEATRASILKELRSVIESDGSHISYRHLAMLVDIMTFKGAIMSITRHGFNRLQTGPLMRCSFEESVEILMDAAAFSEADPLSGISEQVMMGQLANIGTGSFDVVLDIDALTKAGNNISVGNVNNADIQDVYQDTSYTLVDTNNDEDLSGLVQWDSTPHSKPYFSPMSAAYSAAATSSSYLSAYSSSYSAASSRYSPNSAAGNAFSPSSASYSALSSNASPSSASYSPNSSNYSPTSSQYASPISNAYSPSGSASYSPSSASYSPSSANYVAQSSHHSPTSSVYTASPAYAASPTSTHYSPTSGQYSAQSPAYNNNPVSSFYSPNSQAHPQATTYSPNTSYSPTSPGYTNH